MKKGSNFDRRRLICLTVFVLLFFIFSIILYSYWVSERYQEQIRAQLLERARLLTSQYVDYGSLRPFIMRRSEEQVLYKVRVVSLNLLVGVSAPDKFEMAALQRLYSEKDRQEVFGDDRMMGGIEVFRYLRYFKIEGVGAAISLIMSKEAFLKAYWENMRSLILFSAFIIVLTLLGVSIFLRRVVLMAFELDAKNEALIKLQNFKEELSRMLVHDLKNPLTVVISSMSILKGEMLGKITEAQKGVLDISKHSAQQLLAMIMNILDVFKLEEGKMELQPRKLDIKAFLELVVNKQAEMAARENKQVRLVSSFSEPKLMADENILERILDNLVSNALKHTKKEIGRIEVFAIYNENEKMAVIGVKDNGEGIPAKYKDRIFEEFVQVESRKLGTKLDTGLGLTFCRLAVSALGGKIWVESPPAGEAGEEGKGSTFFFTIPQ